MTKKIPYCTEEKKKTKAPHMEANAQLMAHNSFTGQKILDCTLLTVLALPMLVLLCCEQHKISIKPFFIIYLNI